MSHPLTGRRFLRFVGDYVAGRLPERARERFERHLDHCPECVAFLNDLTKISRLAVASHRDRAAPLLAEVPATLVTAVVESLAETALGA